MVLYTDGRKDLPFEVFDDVFVCCSAVLPNAGSGKCVMLYLECLGRIEKMVLFHCIKDCVTGRGGNDARSRFISWCARLWPNPTRRHLYKGSTLPRLFTRLFKSSLSFQRSLVIKMQIPAAGCVYTSRPSAMINSPGRPSSLFTSHLSQCSTDTQE